MGDFIVVVLLCFVLFWFLWFFWVFLTNNLLTVTTLEELNHPALRNLSQMRLFAAWSLGAPSRRWPWLVCGTAADREVLFSNKREIATKEMLRAEGATSETNTQSTLGAAGSDCLPVWTLVHSWVAQFMDHIRVLGSYCCLWGQTLLFADCGTMPPHFTLGFFVCSFVWFFTVLRHFKLKPGIIRGFFFSSKQLCS